MRKLLVFVLLLAACQSAQSSPVPTEKPPATFELSRPTHTPYPTYTPLPTLEPEIVIVEVTPTLLPTNEVELCEGKPNNWHGYWLLYIPGEEVFTYATFSGQCNFVHALFENEYGWHYELIGMVDDENANLLWCTLTREKYKDGEPTGVISTWDCTLKFKNDDVQYRFQGSIQKKAKTHAFCGGLSEELLPDVCKYVP